jgi:hypothetical protein
VSEGFDVKDLNRLARTLAEGADDLEGLAGTAPAIPDAGPSSGAVGSGISALAEVMSKIVQTTANAADEAQASGSTYHRAEDANSETLGRIRGPH